MYISNIGYDNSKKEAKATYSNGMFVKTISFPYSSGDVFAQAATAIKAVEPEAEFKDLPVLDLSKVGKLTKARRIAQLEKDFESARFTIGTYYMEAVLDGNVEVQKDLQTELSELKEQFESDVEAIMSEEE